MSLLLHLVLVGVGPAVDARLEATAGSSDHAQTHVEDSADPACGTGHHHQVCLIRALHSMDAPPEGGRLRIAPTSSPGHRLPVSSVAARSAAVLCSLGPRAPPAA